LTLSKTSAGVFVIKYIFPTPIYFSSICNNNKSLAENILKLLEENTHPPKSGVDGYRIDIDQNMVDNTDLGLGEILEKIQIEIVNYCDQLEIKKQKIISSWININPTHAYNRKHSHSHSCISGAYYVQVPADSQGDFIFHRSREFSDFQWNHLAVDDNQDLKSFINYSPSTDDLLLFPSFIEHEVLPNHSHLPRISISFNTNPM
jgi:uncharacterized protein (TIGR02466 family)